MVSSLRISHRHSGQMKYPSGAMRTVGTKVTVDGVSFVIEVPTAAVVVELFEPLERFIRSGV